MQFTPNISFVNPFRLLGSSKDPAPDVSSDVKVPSSEQQSKEIQTQVDPQPEPIGEISLGREDGEYGDELSRSMEFEICERSVKHTNKAFEAAEEATEGNTEPLKESTCPDKNGKQTMFPKLNSLFHAPSHVMTLAEFDEPSSYEPQSENSCESDANISPKIAKSTPTRPWSRDSLSMSKPSESDTEVETDTAEQEEDNTEQCSECGFETDSDDDDEARIGNDKTCASPKYFPNSSDTRKCHHDSPIKEDKNDTLFPAFEARRTQFPVHMKMDEPDVSSQFELDTDATKILDCFSRNDADCSLNSAAVSSLTGMEEERVTILLKDLQAKGRLVPSPFSLSEGDSWRLLTEKTLKNTFQELTKDESEATSLVVEIREKDCDDSVAQNPGNAQESTPKPSIVARAHLERREGSESDQTCAHHKIHGDEPNDQIRESEQEKKDLRKEVEEAKELKEENCGGNTKSAEMQCLPINNANQEEVSSTASSLTVAGWLKKKVLGMAQLQPCGLNVASSIAEDPDSREKDVPTSQDHEYNSRSPSVPSATLPNVCDSPGFEAFQDDHLNKGPESNALARNSFNCSDIPCQAAGSKDSPCIDRGRKEKEKWTPLEVEALRDGMARYGHMPNRWALIKADPELALALKRRTNVNLKDRWRSKATWKDCGNLNLKIKDDGCHGGCRRDDKQDPSFTFKARSRKGTDLPSAMLGLRVRKKFGPSWLNGWVSSWEHPYWTVTYEDGETEEMDEIDLQAFNCSGQTKRPQDEVDGSQLMSNENIDTVGSKKAHRSFKEQAQRPYPTPKRAKRALDFTPHKEMPAVEASNVRSSNTRKDKRQLWTADEVDALRDGMEKYNHCSNRWALIKADPDLQEILEHRTNVNLKDKWRTIHNSQIKTSKVNMSN